MNTGLIVHRSIGELRRAATEGKPYYSCERFQDAFGRLVVGVGARLEGKALRYVANSGRRGLCVSEVALADGREVPAPEETGEEILRFGEPVDVALRRAAAQAIRAIHHICPRTARQIEDLRPHPQDLTHGLQVAGYAGRLMAAFDRARAEGRISARYPYASATREEVFLAGVMHDVGRWNDGPVRGHTERGARILEARPGRLRELAGIVGQHHTPLWAFSGDGWAMHKAAPVAMAEAVVECPSSSGAAVCRLAAGEAREAVRPLLVVLCSLERVIPPRAVVRLGSRGPFPSELAVSLQAPTDDPFRPYLLRFARWDENGRPVLLFRPGESPARYPHGCGRSSLEGQEAGGRGHSDGGDVWEKVRQV